MTDLQLREKIRVYLLPFKSEYIKKVFYQYCWLFASIAMACFSGLIMSEGYKGALEWAGGVNIHEKALFSISSTAVFCLLFLKKDLAQIFLMLNLGMLAAIKFSTQIFAVVTLSQLFVIEYLMIVKGSAFFEALMETRKKNLTVQTKDGQLCLFLLGDICLIFLIPFKIFHFLVFCT